jgi:hypothetical protein
MSDEISEELANVLRHIRRSIDEHPGNVVYFGPATKKRIEDILDRYDNAGQPVEKSKMAKITLPHPIEDDFIMINNVEYQRVGKILENPKPKFDLKDFLNQRIMVRFRDGGTKTGVIYYNPKVGSFSFQYSSVESKSDDSYGGHHDETILFSNDYTSDGTYLPRSVGSYNICLDIVDIQFTNYPKLEKWLEAK